MAIPTSEQVDIEIATLIQMKPTVREISLFGDDNHHNAIDAQIEVLQQRMSVETAEKTFGDENVNVVFEAFCAARWLSGSTWITAGDKPSDGWLDLVMDGEH
jgi:hypothetical protein